MVQKSSLLAELDVVIAPSRTTVAMTRPIQTGTGTTDTGSTIWCGTDVTTTMTTFTQTIITM